MAKQDDEPPFSARMAEMLAFYKKVGYDPEKERVNSEIRELREKVNRLQAQNDELEEQLRVLKQQVESEVRYISLNLAEYAEQAVIHAIKKANRGDRRNGWS